MLVNIFVERAEATERRNVILFGAERGCFALRFCDVLGESGGFFFRKFVMRRVEVIGERFGFRFGLRSGRFPSRHHRERRKSHALRKLASASDSVRSEAEALGCEGCSVLRSVTGSS